MYSFVSCFVELGQCVCCEANGDIYGNMRYYLTLPPTGILVGSAWWALASTWHWERDFRFSVVKFWEWFGTLSVILFFPSLRALGLLRRSVAGVYLANHVTCFMSEVWVFFVEGRPKLWGVFLYMLLFPIPTCRCRCVRSSSVSTDQCYLHKSGDRNGFSTSVDDAHGTRYRQS